MKGNRMLNKKLVAAVLAATATVFAQAADVTVINTGSKTGGFFRSSNALQQDLAKSMSVEYVNPGQYCAAYAALKKMTGPVLFPWANDFEAAGRSGEGCATIPLKADEIVSYARDTYRVCSAKPEMTKERFVKAGESARVGYSTPAFAFENTVQAVNKSFGTKHVGVTYDAGGGAVKTALVNKEVDYVILWPSFANEVIANGTAKCFWSTGKETLDGMEGIASKDPSNKKLIIGSDTVWLLKNATPAQAAEINKRVQAAYADQNSAIAAQAKKSSPIDFNKSKASIIEDWEDAVNALKK